jgi:hypothetical protein
MALHHWRGVVAAATLALVVGIVIVGTASAHGTAGKTVITSLTVRGNPRNPIFTLTGKNLVVPKPNPATSPSGQSLCPLQITGNAGFDYGVAFYLIAWNAGVNATNAQRYAAGRYRPKLSELDCIGIIAAKQTSTTKLTFTLGHAYVQQYLTNPGPISSGDVVEVVLKGAAFATVVRYH